MTTHVLCCEERLLWHPVAERLPDDEILVLAHMPAAAEPVWPAYLDGTEWRAANGWPLPEVVRHWADMPGGPEGS